MIQFTDATAVANHLRLTQPDELATEVAAATNAYLADRQDLLVPDEADPLVLVPTAAAQLGATMLAARLHRRRNTPNGIEAADGTVASYVARTDPDVARLLGLDSFAAPSVG